MKCLITQIGDQYVGVTLDHMLVAQAETIDTLLDRLDYCCEVHERLSDVDKMEPVPAPEEYWKRWYTAYYPDFYRDGLDCRMD